MANDIIVSEMTSASQINTNDLMIMTQPDLQAETGYSTKKGTVLQVANKMLKGTEYLTDLPDFTDKTVLGGLEELKGDLTALLPVDTASGAIANFDTDLPLPLVDCKANIVATGGNGTPDNPNPINGYTEANIIRCGVNLFDVSTIYEDYQLDGNGDLQAFTGRNTSDFISVKPSTNYYFKNVISGTVTRSGVFYDANKNYISNILITTGSGTTRSAVAQTPSNCAFIRITYEQTATETAVNYPSTDTSYHAYNGTTYAVAFGQTVYGGVLDVTRGKLTVSWGICNLTDYNYTYNSTHGAFYTYGLIGTIKAGTANILCSHYKTNIVGVNVMNNYEISTVNSFNTGNVIIKDSDYTDAATFKTALGTMGAKLAFELATPFDIDLTPVQINALLGVNNVYNDTNGDTEVKYKEGIQHYIDKKIAATQALIL